MNRNAVNSIALAPGGQWVEATVHETPEMERCLDLVTQAVQLAHQHHLKRLMIDLSRVGRSDSQTEQFKEVQQIGQTGLDRSYRVAVLVRPGSTDHDFMAMAFQDAGYNVQVFAGRDNAEAWLAGH